MCIRASRVPDLQTLPRGSTLQRVPFVRDEAADPDRKLNFTLSLIAGCSERVRGLTVMFSSLGLFKKTKCPDIQHCKRTTCVFSHDQGTTTEPVALDIPIHAPKPQPQPQKEKPVPNPSSSSTRSQTVPSKRPASELQTSTVGPPRKISKVGSAQKPGVVPTLTQTHVRSIPLDTGS